MQLHAAVAEGDTVLCVPRDAWISVPLDALELEPETELAWRLLCERWQGEASDFAPYADFLWGVDLSLHPALWEEEEVAWLCASPGAHEEVLRVRQTLEERARALAARACGPSPGAASGAPAEAAHLWADIRRAVVLVEARGIEAGPAAPGGLPCVALVPLLDHLRHDPTEQPVLRVGEDEDLEGAPMLAVANAALVAGDELRHCYEPAGNAHLLAHYGCVPDAAGPSREERLRANAFGTVALPVRAPPDSAKADSEACLQLKLGLLAERCGLDLRPGEPSARLELPRDMSAGGRLLPLARLLTTAVRPEPGESSEAACLALFEELFAGVGTTDPPEVPAPVGDDELMTEVLARAAAWEWCERCLKRYQKACRTIVKGMGVSPQQCEVGADDAGDSGQPAEPEDLVDSVVLAHFKAKSSDRGLVKSKRPRQARVIAVSDDIATVQFLANGVRHQVPKDWIIDGAAEEPPQKIEVNRTQVGRAALALSLFTNEAALVESAYSMTQSVVQMGAQIMQARERAPEHEVSELVGQFRREWESEQEQMRDAARSWEEAEFE